MNVALPENGIRHMGDLDRITHLTHTHTHSHICHMYASRYSHENTTSVQCWLLVLERLKVTCREREKESHNIYSKEDDFNENVQHRKNQRAKKKREKKEEEKKNHARVMSGRML